ncbi:hypothetical protein HYW17_00270 [Candidatus Uhrbacteria bacterium]|nr:hypothetical protein [Candidatus Uhrbacteria bacterium]
MSEATQKQEPEDLSKLKGPSSWYTAALLFSLVVFVTSILFRIHHESINVDAMNGLLLAVNLLVIWGSLASTALVSVGWFVCNRLGHKIWWWKDGDTWRVTARKYPDEAKGLVIEAQVKARPSFKLRWGSKGWHNAISDDGWVVNLKGERLHLRDTSQATLDNEGLTGAVLKFLFDAGFAWRIVPLQAGRMPRFVDRGGRGIEVYYKDDGVDIEEILKSRDCADYHKRMQKKAGEHDASYRLMYEVLKALGLPSPVFDETLVERLEQVQEASQRLREEHDRALDILCAALPALRDAVKRAGRPPTKIKAMKELCRVLVHLDAHLPKDSVLRAQLDVSEASRRMVLRALDEEEAKLAAARGPGVQGDGSIVGEGG